MWADNLCYMEHKYGAQRFPRFTTIKAKYYTCGDIHHYSVPLVNPRYKPVATPTVSHHAEAKIHIPVPGN